MHYDDLKKFKGQCEKMLEKVYKHRNVLNNEDLQNPIIRARLAHIEELEINIEEAVNILSWLTGEDL